MGGGSYDALSARTRSTTYYSKMSREEVFSQKHMDPEMNPHGVKYRESCDSDEHPESYPIIIALDETGSMGQIPEYLIKKTFPDIMQKIMDSGIPNPQVCFVGIGDASYREEAPLQIGQFESSDELMEKWLQKIYLEGLGGGNMGESYNLAWYFAARHTRTDSFDKRHMKGCLITIGDEPCLKHIGKSAISRYIGDNVQDDILTSEILKEAKEKWNVYHIHVNHGGYSFDETNWPELLGINAVESSTDNISNVIPKLVKISFDSEKN